jgi:hypothetical protein
LNRLLDPRFSVSETEGLTVERMAAIVNRPATPNSGRRKAVRIIDLPTRSNLEE